MSTSSRPASNKLYLMIWDYYKRAPFDPPPDLPQREVALQNAEGKMIRHMAVVDVEGLRKLVLEKKGIDLYVSTASYQTPDAPSMDAKGWLRADLQFDIDVDHMEGCGPTYKVCGDQVVPSSEDCEGEEIKIIPSRCLYVGFEKAKRLVDVLRRYLGVEKENIEIHFSGNRGFHVVARGTPFDEADQAVRREIVDFVTGNLLKKDIFCLEKNCVIPKPGEPGWRGRVGEVLERMLPKDVETWGELDDPEALLERAIASAKIDVDEQVTVDTSRLLRVPMSVNRKSALLVKKVKKFAWTEELSPFKNYLTLVKSKYDMELDDVLGKKVRLRKNEKAELPGSLGAFLASKGLVDILRFDGPGKRG